MSEGFVTTKGFEEGIGRVARRPEGARAPAAGRERRGRDTAVRGFVGCHVVRALLDSGRKRVVAFDVNEPSPEGRFVIGERLEEVVFERGSIDDTARFFDVVRTHVRTRSSTWRRSSIRRSSPPTGRRCSASTSAASSTCSRRRSRSTSSGSSTSRRSASSLRVEYEPIDAKHPIFLADRGPGHGLLRLLEGGRARHSASPTTRRTASTSARSVLRPSTGVGMTPWVGPIKQMVEGSVRGEQLTVRVRREAPARLHARERYRRARRRDARRARRRRPDLLRGDRPAARDDERGRAGS